MAGFVPVADEVGRLQRGKDAECLLFQQFAEKGHYGGRTKPSNTRQGIYAITPAGTFLASCNTRRPEDVAKTMHQALERWRDLDPSARQLTEAQRLELAGSKRWIDRYPDDGLVLRITSRDLPGAKQGRGWKRDAWNLDFAWFREDEARAFLPAPGGDFARDGESDGARDGESDGDGQGARPAIGARREVPRRLVERLVRLHLVDNVRGQVAPFAKKDVERAELRTEVVKIEGMRLHLRLEGVTRAERRGRWPVAGFHDGKEPAEQVLGFETTLLGSAVWDHGTSRFIAFELVGVGTRWGGSQFNGRGDDLGRGPIGVVLQLSSGAPDERVAPARIWDYGW